MTSDEGLRPATDHERYVAQVFHGTTELEVDDNAQCAEGSEGVWVQAWVWISVNQLNEMKGE